MNYFVYILECADKSLYTGVTTDILRRLEEHKKGIGGHYTRAHGAKRMVYTEEALSRSAAQKREAAIKHLSRVEKLMLVKKNRVRS